MEIDDPYSRGIFQSAPLVKAIIIIQFGDNFVLEYRFEFPGDTKRPQTVI